MDTRMTDALVAIRRIVRAAEFGARDLARETGLTPSQSLLLQLLSRAGAAGAGAIAKDMRLSQGTVTSLLDKLEEAGLVIRKRADDDRRRVTVQITPEGRRAVRLAPNALQDTFAAKFEAMADWEKSMILAALQRVCALLDAEEIDASPVLDVGPLDRSVEP